MTKIKWGILSTAKIGLEKVIPAMQKGKYCEIIAIASRDTEKARYAAERLTIPRSYSSYEELLEDDDIEAIYNPLPNHLHVPWSIKALAAGKHVLCEKPVGLNSEDALKLLEISRKYPQLKVMEAFMYRFHPQWKGAKKLVQQGEIGDLRTIQTFFSYFNDDPNNIRNMVAIGGGGLMDIGCYCISLSRFISDREPQRICGLLEYDPIFNTDFLTSGMMDFGDCTSTFTCSTQLTPFQRVNIFGTKGRIEIEIPFNAPPNKQTVIWHQKDHKISEIIFDPVDQYTLQGDEFSLAILNDIEVPTPLDDAVANMKIMDAMIESAQKGSWL